MSEEKLNTEETLTEEAKVVEADGGAAEENVVVKPKEEQKTIKDILGEKLGKEFASDEVALKAVQDTFSYVGKKKEDIAKELMQETKESQRMDGDALAKIEQVEKKMREQSFYAENPELKGYKELIAKFGDNPEEVVKTEEFKSVFEKVKGYDELQSSQSVLHSNPRLAGATDKMTQAREALKEGNIELAQESAVSAVLDAYDMR